MVKRIQCGQLIFLPIRCGGVINLRGVAASNLLPSFRHFPSAAVLSMKVLEFHVEPAVAIRGTMKQTGLGTCVLDGGSMTRASCRRLPIIVT
jgi:hypothetical protein